MAVSPAGRVRIDLLADQRLLADELVSRYGSRLDARLGAFAYPDMNRRSSVDPGPDTPCPTIPTPGPSKRFAEMVGRATACCESIREAT